MIKYFKFLSKVKFNSIRGVNTNFIKYFCTTITDKPILNKFTINPNSSIENLNNTESNIGNLNNNIQLWKNRYNKRRIYEEEQDLLFFKTHIERKRLKEEFQKNNEKVINPPKFELKIFHQEKTIILENKKNKFSELNLHPQILKNLNKMEFDEMTEIQKNVINLIDEGNDVMACSKTGSGKTIAFLLPVINKLLHSKPPITPKKYGTSFPVVVVLVPTRELVEQIYEEAKKLCYLTGLIPSKAYGGVSYSLQLREIRNGADIVIATPGRFNDFLKKGCIDLLLMRNLILDEADRMFDMGFEPQIDEIICGYNMPEANKRQNLFFSATFSKEIQKIAKIYMNDYYMVSVNNSDDSIVNENIKHQLIKVDSGNEKIELVRLVQQLKGSILIFSETKIGVRDLERWFLNYKIVAVSIHGDKMQEERQAVLNDFSNGKVRILIATDVASRGIDFPNISYVINIQIPRNIQDYIHRIGRTGRNGSPGTAITLIKNYEPTVIKELYDILKKFKQEIPDWFEIILKNSNEINRGKNNKSNFKKSDDIGTKFNDSKKEVKEIESNKFKNDLPLIEQKNENKDFDEFAYNEEYNTESEFDYNEEIEKKNI